MTETVKEYNPIILIGRSHEPVKLFGHEVVINQGYIMIRRLVDHETGKESTIYVDSSEDLEVEPKWVKTVITRFRRWRFEADSMIYGDGEFVNLYIIPAIERGELPKQLNPFEIKNGYLVLKRSVNCRFRKNGAYSKTDTDNIAMIMRAVGLKAGLVRD